jgi:MFS transporter, DHA2 family, multidrug resistance protein
MNSADDGLPVPRRYWAILTLMIGVALSCLDTALVNVALPTIARDLNASPANQVAALAKALQITRPPSTQPGTTPPRLKRARRFYGGIGRALDPQGPVLNGATAPKVSTPNTS